MLASACTHTNTQPHTHPHTNFQVDVVLGSDIVYEPKCFQPLAQTLSELLPSPGVRDGNGGSAYIAHRPRHPDEHLFWAQVCLCVDRGASAQQAGVPDRRACARARESECLGEDEEQRWRRRRES